MELDILSKYRDIQCPAIDPSLTILSKEECLKKLDDAGVDGLKLCRLGDIDSSPENLCKFVFFTNMVGAEGKGTSCQGRKRKHSDVAEETAVKKLEEKVSLLSKQLAEKKKADEVTDVERIRREAKEEAAKGEMVNVDILTQKLILLENLATKTNHESKKEVAMIMSRFNAHKTTAPAFAASLALKLLSSKEEESILDKEQKLMKQFGMNVARPQTPFPVDPWQHMFPFGSPSYHSVNWPRHQHQYRPRSSPARSDVICFKCRQAGHYMRDCKA